jgi:hypothetical protein
MTHRKTSKIVAQGINAPLAFLLELAMLAAYGYWGFHVGHAFALQLALGIGVPVVIVVIWAKWLAPRATKRLKMPWLVLVKAVLFGLAAYALYLSDQRGASMWFTLAIGAHLLLMLPSREY